MLSFLPVVCFLLFFLVLYQYPIFDNLRSTFLASTIFGGLIVTVITEGLNVFKVVARNPLITVWILLIVLTIVLLITSPHRKIKIFPASFHHVVRQNPYEISLLLPIISIVILIGITAIFAAPNNFDSMTYHLSRIVHWIQNKSINHYPTHIIYQLHQNPWSEFAILHLMLLSGSDRYANLVQWFFMGCSILGVTFIVKAMGGDIRAQVFSAVICVTLPMGILQGSSTQTDYVAAYWLVCVLYFSLVFRRNRNIPDAIALGISLGLAILTKATSYIFVFPIMVWLTYSILTTGKKRNLLLLVLCFAIALAINTGHYLRNYGLYKNPLGPMTDFETSYSNEIISIPSVVSNVSKNVALHLGTPFESINANLEEAFYNFHRWIGFSPNDPRTTWPDTEFRWNSFIFHEDHAGNPIHLLLIVISLRMVLSKRADLDERNLSLSLLLGFILFCVYLKWQPWNSRLHLPFFVLYSPILGLMIARLKMAKLANVFMVCLIISVMPWVLQNPSRPLIGQGNVFVVDRADQYFTLNQKMRKPFQDAAQFLKQTKCNQYGLIVGNNDIEYPLWVYLMEPEGHKSRLEHVNVTNSSKVLSDASPYSSFSPCALLVMGMQEKEIIIVRGIPFFRNWMLSPVSVYLISKPSDPHNIKIIR